MKILFVGESWRGSFARSLREALDLLPDVDIDDLGEDHYSPKGGSLLVRVANRLLRPFHRRELERAIQSSIDTHRPDVLMAYKGSVVAAATVRSARRAGVFTVNVFPDCSPHAHSTQLKAAIGEYDLVVSTKAFHPAAWGPVYGYTNDCVFVPHGYNPDVHFWSDPPEAQDLDVVLAATWRPEYHSLMRELAAGLSGHAIRVGIIGSGWTAHKKKLPSEWQIAPPLYGRRYGEWLRRGRIVVAPVSRDVVVRGVGQPGDEDTTRTYELAAMGCFFLHRRTAYAQLVYDEQTEVPMWDDPEELAALVLRYLPLEERRREMAARAHARAVPTYSIPNRARQVLEHIKLRTGTVAAHQ